MPDLKLFNFSRTKAMRKTKSHVFATRRMHSSNSVLFCGVYLRRERSPAVREPAAFLLDLS